MLANNAVSAVIGFVPIVGDIMLASYKANSRNAALLEEYLRIRGEEFLKVAAERTEDPADVRPGAGRKADERVPGAPKEASTSGGGWFRRLSGGNKNSGKGKETSSSPNPPEVVRRESRFVEDVPDTSKPTKK
jgi:hypothetical protein